MIEEFANWVVLNFLKVDAGTHLAESMEFFFVDVIKILFLLFLMTHLMSLFRFYFPIGKLRNFLTTRNFFGADYFLASIFGALTPFCSCSSIPLFIGFLGARIKIGVTFAFLITSPLINEVAVAIFIGVFGWKITIIYILAGIIIGVLGGFILEKMGVEKYLTDYIKDIQESGIKTGTATQKKKLSIGVLRHISKEAFSIVKGIAIYVIVGVAVGAVIHGYVPAGFFEHYITKENIFAVPISVILAVPMYSNASGVIPIIESLVDKGVPLGTALAFMMAVVGVSLPEALILKKVMKLPLLGAFFGVVTIGIIIIGYLFNFIS